MIENTQWYNYEGLDRCSMLISYTETAFWKGDHPSLDTPEKKALYIKAVESLAELYQKIGETEEDFYEQVR